MANEDIRKLIRDKNILQKQLAAECGITESSLSRMLRNEMSDSKKRMIRAVINGMPTQEPVEIKPGRKKAIKDEVATQVIAKTIEECGISRHTVAKYMDISDARFSTYLKSGVPASKVAQITDFFSILASKLIWARNDLLQYADGKGEIN